MITRNYVNIATLNVKVPGVRIPVRVLLTVHDIFFVMDFWRGLDGVFLFQIHVSAPLKKR